MYCTYCLICDPDPRKRARTKARNCLSEGSKPVGSSGPQELWGRYRPSGETHLHRNRQSLHDAVFCHRDVGVQGCSKQIPGMAIIFGESRPEEEDSCDMRSTLGGA